MTKIYNDLSKFFFSLQISLLIFLITTNSLVIIDLKNSFESNTVFMRVLSEQDILLSYPKDGVLHNIETSVSLDEF